VKGVSRVLRKERPETKIVVAEPDNAQILGSGIPQPPSVGGLMTSHPLFRPHPIQGTSPDFIPKLAGDAIAEGWVDLILPVNGGDAMRLSRELAQREGVFCGISSGAALAAALTVAETAPKGTNILCMLPDTGERYLSTPLFDDIAVDMTAEEEAISKSTPLCRFDIRPAAAPAPVEARDPGAPADAEAAAFVDKVIAEDPVVMFALEWCEFCWAARKLFRAHAIPYRSIDLDSVAYQERDWGGRVRRAVGARVGAPTIPQIFIGGEPIGGTAEVFDAARSGDLQRRLRDAGVRFDADAQVDYAALLPKWLKKTA
jgi:cysteine synthase A